MLDTAISPTVSVLERLRSAERLLDEIDVSALDGADLPAITGAMRRIEARCAAVAVAVAAQARASGDDSNATLIGTGQVSGHRARQEAKRADVVEHMPEMGQALQSGQISGEHVDAIARARSSLTEDESSLLDELAPELAAAAGRLPVDTFNRQLRSLIDQARADHGMTRLEQQRARSGLKMWTDGDGMGHLHVTADPERFAKLQTAIEHQTASMAAAANDGGEPVTKGPSLQLDALVELVGTVEGVAGRPSITIVVDQATLSNGRHEHSVCETSSGLPLPVPVADRYLCDADVRRVVLDEAGLSLNVGRRHRTATPAQWAALEALYATCVWDNCDVPFTWCQAHHVQHWEHGGPTDLWNLAPLCGRHHHVVHDDGWLLILHPDRTLEIHRPSPHPSPPGRPPPLPSPESLWAVTRPDRIPGYE